MIHAIGSVALWVGVIAGAAFCVAYHLSARWWTSAEGRHLMTFTGALAAILAWLAYRSTAGPARAISGSEEIVRLAVYAVVAALMLWRLGLLWRRQLRPGLRRREKEHDGHQ